MENIRRYLEKLVLQSLLIGPGILAVSAVFCLLGGQFTLNAFGTAVTNIGIVALAIGSLTALGVSGADRSTSYQVARTASAPNIFQRARQDFSDANRRLSFTVPVFGGGILACLLGFLLLAATTR